MHFFKKLGFIKKRTEKLSEIIKISNNYHDLDLEGDFGQTLDLLERTDANCFITGKAGTGKSTLLKCYKENSKKKMVCLAPTGIAAVNINGQTIHSFFRFPPRPLTNDDIRLSRIRELYQEVETIIIDEISMVRADLLDAIDKFLRMNRYEPEKPFGGVQMLLFGDIFQLQPIVRGEEQLFFATYYTSPYFFDAKVFYEADFKIIDLNKVYRQKDIEFINLLDSIRLGNLNEEDIEKINSRLIEDGSDYPQNEIITLTSTNRIASDINEYQLSKIHSDEYRFKGKIEGDFPTRTLPTDFELRLKRDAQIMFVKNDHSGRWVNGTIAKIHQIGVDFIEVEIDENGNKLSYSVDPVKWEIQKYKYDYSEHKIITEVVGVFIQYPLKLAWAITIHKSQGLTFDKVIIDIGNGAFAHGQTYVALSRCTNFEGITLNKRINFSDILVDLPVKRFYKS